MSEGAVITLSLAFLSAVIWAVRVEGIVRAHEQQISQLRDDMDHKLDALLVELRYIRERVDESVVVCPLSPAPPAPSARGHK